MGQSISPEDIRLLEKTQSIREKMVDNYIATSKQLPTTPRDLEAFGGLLDSIDKSIFSRAKISIEEKDNEINAGTKAILGELLIKFHEANTDVNPTIYQDREIPKYNPSGIEVKEGELVLGHDTSYDIEKHL